MTRTLLLQHGPIRCELRPDLGGCIAGLWHAGVPVLRSTPGDALHSVRQSGCYPLVPFSNRIAHATLLWQGTGHPLVRNFAPEPHAIHGVGWQRPWEVLEDSPTMALLAHEHRPDAAWPFAYDASQTLVLRENGMELSLSVTNQSGKPAPLGLGWHPYFVKRPGARLRFSATGRWDMGEDKLPTTLQPHGGIDGLTEALEVDHCFEGWNGEATLDDEQLRLRIRSGLPRLVVFTRPDRDTVAIEPVSHASNALSRVAQGMDATQLGVHVLEPGATLTAQMQIDIEAAV